MQGDIAISKKKGPPHSGRTSFARRKIVDNLQMELEKADVKLPIYVIQKIVPAFFKTLKNLMIESNHLAIRDLGTIELILNKGKIILHPETREEYACSPHYKIHFKPEASFRRLLQEKAKKEVQKL